MREADRGGQLRVTSSGILSGRASTSGADWDWIVRAVRPPQLEAGRCRNFLHGRSGKAGGRFALRIPRWNERTPRRSSTARSNASRWRRHSMSCCRPAGSRVTPTATSSPLSRPTMRAASGASEGENGDRAAAGRAAARYRWRLRRAAMHRSMPDGRSSTSYRSQSPRPAHRLQHEPRAGDALRVSAEPAGTPREILDQVLRPHGLHARPGAQGVLIVARAEASR